MSDRAVVVIGAGPAGLAAMSALEDRDCLLIEAGQAYEQRDWADELRAGEGVGGAGLYSDGKFSYHPAATLLWRLDEARLTRAYAWLVSRLDEVGIYAPREWGSARAVRTSGPEFKDYESVYASTEQRTKLISALASGGELRVNERVLAIRRHHSRWVVETTRGTHACRHIVLAMGRFGPLGPFRDSWTRFRRIEVGVRILQSESSFFLRSHPSLDPKLIFHNVDKGVEWRTFCCCRNGTTIVTRTAGLVSLSGRADGPPTGLSNVGFNVRLLDEVERGQTWAQLEHLGSGSVLLDCPLEFGVANSKPFQDVYGPALSGPLAEGLRRLRDFHGSDWLDGARLVGPTIEGVGYYPEHDAALGCDGYEDLWVAGDMSGSFRGLVAALVSGRMVGEAVRERMNSE